MGGARLAALALLLAVAGLVAMRVDEILGWIDPDALTRALEDAGSAAPILFVGLMALVVVAAPLPSLPLDIAAGLHFGWLVGGLYAATGATIGACLGFAIARWLGRDLVQRWVGGHATFCPGCSNTALVGVVFASRLVPFVSFDAVSYGAGLTAMSLPHFAVATFVGTLPLTFLYTAAGAAIEWNLRAALWLALPIGIVVFALPRLLERAGAPLGRWAHRAED